MILMILISFENATGGSAQGGHNENVLFLYQFFIVAPWMVDSLVTLTPHIWKIALHKPSSSTGSNNLINEPYT